MLIRYPRTVRVSEKFLALASDSSNQQTLVLKKKISVKSVKTRFNRICANDLKACNLDHLLRSNTQNYLHLKALYIKAYI